LLRVIGVGFQLYSQLKKSPHDVTGVLGSSAVSMVSQATRLGKGSSVTTRDEHVSKRAYYGEIVLEWNFALLSLFFWFLSCHLLPFFLYCKALLCYLNISPVPTCLVHNCETSRSLISSICCHSCLEIKFPLIPISGDSLTKIGPALGCLPYSR